MKILIVNTYDIGGAANACLRLHEGLLNKGIESNVLLRDQNKNIVNTNKFIPIKKRISKFQKVWLKLKRIIKYKPSKNDTFIKNRSTSLEQFSFPTSNYDITKSNLYKEADIINLHWVAHFLDYKTFFKKNTKPVVWTLHDMNPFTGGEHYEEIYLGIGGDGKPQQRIKTVQEKLISEINLNYKKRIIMGFENLTIVTPSKWLVGEAMNSEIFKSKRIVHIPYGINKHIYRPRGKNYSRDVLKIPKDKKVILFVADYITNNRKGFIYLKNAFKQLNMDEVVLCAVGNKNEVFISNNRVIELGVINDEKLLSMAYSAADVFVIPSLMDNLPNTVLESLMCGTPVIGFPVGGIPDMIKDGVNGLLTKEISVSSLLDTLKQFLNQEFVFDTDKIRNDAVMNYSLEKQADKYKELFNNILS